jgi:hypothetical protein
MPRSVVAVFLALSVVLVCETSGTVLAGKDEPVKATGAPAIAVATEQKAATVQVQDAASSGGRLEVTARPVTGARASPPYLVGVFEGDGRDAAPRLLGSFSFYPPRAGEAQTFVIPRSQFDRTKSKGTDTTLSIKLIPANPAANIKDAAVEILGARVIE